MHGKSDTDHTFTTLAELLDAAYQLVQERLWVSECIG
jgi:hypothetical protein